MIAFSRKTIPRIINPIYRKLGPVREFEFSKVLSTHFSDNPGGKLLINSTMGGDHLATSPIRNIDPSNKVYVQTYPENEMMTISFTYVINGNSKQFNLYRRKSEPLSSCIDRIKCSLFKVNKSRREGKSDAKDASKDIHVEITMNGSIIDPEKTINADAWIDGVSVDLNGSPYIVRTDCPAVKSMTLPSRIMKGFITLVNVNLVNCDNDNCEILWYRQISAQERREMIEKGLAEEDQVHYDDRNFWYKLSKGLTYCPGDEDLAHYIKVVCLPSDGTKKGPEYSCLSFSPVELGPSECPFEKRHLYTRDLIPTPSVFRFVSYNILANLYADSEYSRSVLFAHCPSYALDYDYRRQLLLKEISGYNADIVCLQEVDKKEFSATFQPFFKQVRGMTGVFNPKGYQTAEGLATFFRDDKFELMQSHRILLSELIEEFKPNQQSNTKHKNEDMAKISDEHEIKSTSSNMDLQPHFILCERNSDESKRCLAKFDQIRSAIVSNEQLKERFMDVHTILQISLLKFKDNCNKYLMVANTHLYFAPDADHIRLLQGSTCVKYIEYIKEYYERMVGSNADNSNSDISVIFCGDMNSDPSCGLRKLLLEGKISSDLKDWNSNKEEKVTGLGVETYLKFKSSYDNIEYTNYTPLFNGCLDYIYYQQDNIICESVVPLPDHETVVAIGGIPSDVFPSDHLALIANLKRID